MSQLKLTLYVLPSITIVDKKYYFLNLSEFRAFVLNYEEEDQSRKKKVDVAAEFMENVSINSSLFDYLK
jgi:hypothetical protein